MDSKLQTIATIYDKRAPQYDDEPYFFHRAQAADYLTWLAPTPGLSILDLACGTGALAIPLAKAVGPTGKVVGVDISAVSLKIASSKASSQNLNVTFVHHDISNLDSIPSISPGEFDIITCAAAFVLLQDPAAAVKNWAQFLKPGGKLMTDTPTRDTMVPGYILDEVGLTLGIPIPLVYGRTKLDTLEKVKTILEDAGLDSKESFVTKSYDVTVFEVEQAGEKFDEIVGRKGWMEGVYAAFEDPAVRDSARAMFCERFQERGDAEGKVTALLTFNMGVGTKL